MWKICVTLPFWMQILMAQQVVYTINSRGDSGKNATKISDKYDNNTESRSSHSYNTNSRDSFVNTHAEAYLRSDTKEKDFNVSLNTNSYIVNNLSTKSFMLDGDSRHATEYSSTCEISRAVYFNSKLFGILSSKAQFENLVFSPISLQTILAFIFTMSDGNLFEELAQLLAISNNRTCVAKIFENILQTISLNTSPTTTLIIMANKLYYDFRFGQIDYDVRNFAKKSFASELEQIDFIDSKNAVDIINSWISERTHNLIQDIIMPSSISSDTSALLLNSLYFKSEWLTKFATYDTETEDFFITKQRKVPVKMMYNEDVFRYADFPNDLQAAVVELPYITPNLSMLLILPKDVEGLAALEKKIQYYDFESIAQKLKRETVTVKLPQFKIEYEVDMINPLQEMGLTTLFNKAGNINLFKNQPKPLKIDQLKHKCFINVNEAGTEAAATTVAKYVSLSAPIQMKYFIADHPFLFVVRDSNTTFFIGHVVQF